MLMAKPFSCLYFQPLLLTKTWFKLLVASDALPDFHNRIWKDDKHLIGKLRGILITLRRNKMISRIVCFILSAEAQAEQHEFASYGIFKYS